MKARSFLFLSSVLVSAFMLGADARAATGSSFCPPCSSTSDCQAGATCFDGNCVFYDDGNTSATLMSTGTGGAAGAGSGIAGTSGGGGIAGTGGGGVATGAAGTGGCVSDAECQAVYPRSKCLSGACHVAPCVTSADCIAPETCDSTITPGFPTCVTRCAWLASTGGTGGNNATGTGGVGGFSGSSTVGSLATGSAGSGALGGAGGENHGAGDAWHIGEGCSVAGAPGGRAGVLAVLLAFAALLFRRARPAPSRSARR